MLPSCLFPFRHTASAPRSTELGLGSKQWRSPSLLTEVAWLLFLLFPVLANVQNLGMEPHLGNCGRYGPHTQLKLQGCVLKGMWGKRARVNSAPITDARVKGPGQT